MDTPPPSDMLTLSQASKLFPARRRGARPSISCAYRWSTTGCKGIILKTWQCGGTRVTTLAAISEFIERLSAQAGLAQTTIPSRSPTARRRANEKAAAELEAEGI